MNNIISAFLLVTISWYTGFAQPISNNDREVVFRSVNVIPMDSERIIENQTVITKEGRITFMGDTKLAKVAKGALIIDCTGKYLIPGLAEMHAHVPPIDNIEPMKEVLMLYLAGGITTIRGMLGHPRHLELRTKINTGEILGPHFYSTGPSFNGQSVKTANRGIEMVKQQKVAGYDYLKLHPGLTQETFGAIAAAAKEAGIPFAGHVSFGVGIWAAIEAGYSSIDHLDGMIEAITPGVDTLAEQQTGLFGSWIADKADEAKIPELVKALAENKIWLVPTQALAERWLSSKSAEVFLADPEMKYMKPEVLANWANAKANYLSNPNFNVVKADKLIEIRKKLIAASHQAGVGLLLGSDAPQIFNVPGFSIHHELAYLVEAGLTPFQALQTGTSNVARYLGSNDSGMIKAGFVSDLVLLEGNPLKDIQQSRKISGVLIDSRWLSRAYLDSELKNLEKR